MNCSISATYISYWDEGVIETDCKINSDASITNIEVVDTDFSSPSCEPDQILIRIGNGAEYRFDVVDDGEVSDDDKNLIISLFFS